MKICDAHNDFLTELKTDNEKNKYICSLLNNKQIKYISCVIWTSNLKNPIETFTDIKNKYFGRKQKKLILCLEDLGFINKNNFIFAVKKVIDLKPFSCGIVWNNDNTLGGGAFGNSGLTTLGKQVVLKLEANNIIIDTAHMNSKTFWQFCKITSKPIYNSHCNLQYFKKHKRNLSHNQIKQIINSNGFIGLSFVQKFISNNDIDAKIVAKQIVYFVNNYGDNNIGIGSDFYGTKSLPKNLSNYNNFKLLKKELKQQGLTNKIINKIFYKNYVSFIKRNYNIKN